MIKRIAEVLEYIQSDALGKKIGAISPCAVLINSDDDALIIKGDDFPIKFLSAMHGDIELIDLLDNEYRAQAALHEAVTIIIAAECFLLDNDKLSEEEKLGGSIRNNPESRNGLRVQVESANLYTTYTFDVKHKHGFINEIDFFEKVESNKVTGSKERGAFKNIISPSELEHMKGKILSTEDSFHIKSRDYWASNGSIISTNDLIKTLNDKVISVSSIS